MPDQRWEIVECGPGWPDKFAIQRGRVTAVLGPWLASPVEHIGSTSVPGLSAKPVIHMLAPVRSLQVAHDAVGVLEAAGWLFCPEDPCRHYRLWFLGPRPRPPAPPLLILEA